MLVNGISTQHDSPLAPADASSSGTEEGCGLTALNEPIAVVGLGSTGLAAVRFLRARHLAVEVHDSHPEPAGRQDLAREFPEVPMHLGALDAQALAAAGTLVVSPGVPLALPELRQAREAGVDILGDIELFARFASAPVVAITGSNGKSTVTTLVAQMVAAAGHDVLAGGNLGPPALALLDEHEPEFYVLELSSFQLESLTSLDAAVGTVLNVSPDHMDRYASFEEYAATKQRVFRGTGVMVVNRDESPAVHEPGRRVISFGLGEPADGDFGIRTVQGKQWLAHGHVLLARCDALPLPGKHNIANALAALAMGEALGLSMVAMIGALLDFKGLEHRCELVSDNGGVRWFNDSKGTNVGAACAAIAGFADSGPLILLAGGEGKDADFAPLADACAAHVKVAVLFGRDAQLIEQAMDGRLPVIRANDLAGAVKAAAMATQAGDIVLFSPACASFDMFANYEARGRAFKDLVEELAKQ